MVRRLVLAGSLAVCVWDGCPIQPEDEREMQHAWEEDDQSADEWRGGEPPFQGDEWKRDWGTGPEQHLNWRGFFGDDGDGQC